MHVANGSRGSYSHLLSKPSISIIDPWLNWVRNDLGGDAMVWLMALLDDEDRCRVFFETKVFQTRKRGHPVG